MRRKIKILLITAVISLELIFIIMLLKNLVFSNLLTGSYIELITTFLIEPPEHPANFSRNSNNTILSRELKPNFHQILDGSKVKLRAVFVDINSDGLRDREFSIEKPNNTYRIIFLGDSFTFGWLVELNESYVKFVERKLNEMEDTIIYEVLNFGVPGYNLAQKVESLNYKGIKYDPDLIILQYLHDDVDYENSTKKYELLEKGFDKLNKLVRPHKIDVFIVNFSPIEDEIGDIFKKYNWYYLDMEYDDCPYTVDVLHPLDGHPDANSHLCIGEKIYNFLIENSIV